MEYTICTIRYGQTIVLQAPDECAALQGVKRLLVSSQMEITEEAVTWLHIVAGCSLKSLLCHGIETIENRRGVPRLFSVLLGSMECLAQPDWKRTSRHNMLRMLRLAIISLVFRISSICFQYQNLSHCLRVIPYDFPHGRQGNTPRIGILNTYHRCGKRSLYL